MSTKGREFIRGKDVVEKGKIDLQEFITKARRSVEYSEQINEQIKTQPEVTDEEKARRKAGIRKRLLGK